MNWKFTVILHPVRRKMGISANEYCVYDFIFKSQTHPDFNVNGWCNASHRAIGSVLGISEGTVFAIIDRGVQWGLCEVDPANPNHKKTLEKWYNFAYLDDADLEAVEIEPVQKPNAAVQKPNEPVQKPNANRSETEHYKVLFKEERNEKEKGNVRLIDEAVAILQFFNATAGRKVSTSVKGRGSENVGFVLSLLRKGYTRDEVETMIVFKCWEWKGSPKMEKHLEPITIFKRHGAEYIERAIEAQQNPEFAEVLRRAKDAEKKAEGQGQVIAGDFSITRRTAESLQNW